MISVIRPFTQEDENQAAMQKKKYEKYRRSWIDRPVMRLHASSSIEWARQSSTHRILDRVLDLACPATIDGALRRRLGQSEPFIACLQQNRPAAAADMRLVELHHHRAAKQVGKQNTLRCDA